MKETFSKQHATKHTPGLIAHQKSTLRNFTIVSEGQEADERGERSGSVAFRPQNAMQA